MAVFLRGGGVKQGCFLNEIWMQLNWSLWSTQLNSYFAISWKTWKVGFVCWRGRLRLTALPRLSLSPEIPAIGNSKGQSDKACVALPYLYSVEDVLGPRNGRTVAQRQKWPCIMEHCGGWEGKRKAEGSSGGWEERKEGQRMPELKASISKCSVKGGKLVFLCFHRNP